jgi:hypothetical protein
MRPEKTFGWTVEIRFQDMFRNHAAQAITLPFTKKAHAIRGQVPD